MTKQKCIVVAYPIGRTGSSMLMGLLSKHGLLAGWHENFVSADAMNPKGFYELKDQDETLARVFKNVYPMKGQPPSVDWTFKRAGQYKRRYKRYLYKQFGDNTFIIKSPRCLSLALFDKLKYKFDVTVVYLTRNKKDQIKSLTKVNPEGPEFFKVYLDNWYKYSEELISNLSFPIVRVQFEYMLKSPEEVLEKILVAASLSIAPDKEIIDGWIDEKLINRERNV